MNKGIIIRAIMMIANIPHADFKYDKLEVTVFKASFIDEPTRGTRLLKAKRIVFKETESAL